MRRRELHGVEEDFNVQIIEERRGVPTRRQVSADGRTIEDVPITGEEAELPAATLDRAKLANPRKDIPRPVAPATSPAKKGFFVQAGAFAVEANALSLQQRLQRLGQQSYVDRDKTLYRVRIGPIPTVPEFDRLLARLKKLGVADARLALD